LKPPHQPDWEVCCPDRRYRNPAAYIYTGCHCLARSYCCANAQQHRRANPNAYLYQHITFAVCSQNLVLANYQQQ